MGRLSCLRSEETPGICSGEIVVPIEAEQQRLEAFLGHAVEEDVAKQSIRVTLTAQSPHSRMPKLDSPRFIEADVRDVRFVSDTKRFRLLRADRRCRGLLVDLIPKAMLLELEFEHQGARRTSRASKGLN